MVNLLIKVLELVPQPFSHWIPETDSDSQLTEFVAKSVLQSEVRPVPAPPRWNPKGPVDIDFRFTLVVQSWGPDGTVSEGLRTLPPHRNSREPFRFRSRTDLYRHRSQNLRRSVTVLLIQREDEPLVPPTNGPHLFERKKTFLRYFPKLKVSLIRSRRPLKWTLNPRRKTLG